TGNYGFPIEKAAPIAVAAVNDFLKDNDVIEKVVFVLFDEYTYQEYVKAGDNRRQTNCFF
ncbi:MAG: RNase III inhibitor, partial [Candidatus Margulisiibacteriota bacterium]